MSVLVDTNVLLRRIQPDHAHHAPAIDSVARLLASGEQVNFTLQNISEPTNKNSLIQIPSIGGQKAGFV